MIGPIVYLAPAGLALIAALVHLVAPHATRVPRAVAIVGCAFGAALVVVADDVGGWRAVEPTEAAGAVAGAAAAVGWAVVATSSHPARGAIGVGVGASSLALFAGAAWVVPALLFLVCGLLAAGALVADGGGRALTWFSIVAAGIAISGAFGMGAWDSGGWELVAPSGAYLGLAYGGALVAIGVLPVLSWQGIAAERAQAAVPLVVGTGFVTLAKIGGAPAPWLAAALLALALALAIGAWLSRLTIAVVGAWSSATFAGISVAAPDATVVAGIAALLVAGAVTLWPHARGRGRMSRGLLLSVAPPTVGFGAVVAGIARSFDEATAGPDAVLVWAIVVALLPVTLAAGVVVGCGAARGRASDDFEPAAVLATWFLLAAAISAGAFLQTVVEVPAVVARASAPLLYPVALAAGVIAALRVGGGESVTGTIDAGIAVGEIVLSRWLQRAVLVVTVLLSAAVVAGIGWLTVEGLAVGFLR